MKLRDLLHVPPTPAVRIGFLVAVGLIGLVDLSTRWEFSFFVFYAIPIFLVAWSCPKNFAIAYTILCAAIAWAANFQDVPSQTIHSWRSLNRLVAFSFVAMTGATVRSQREMFQSRLEAMERSRELEREIVRLSERQQRLLGQELHDSVCQDLAAMDCAIAVLKSELRSSSPGEIPMVEEIQGILQKSIFETRSLARGIFPVQVGNEGLPVAIEELVATVNRHHDVSVKLNIDGSVSISDPETGMHLYRIVQEALNNAVRHAQATEITISLNQSDRCFDMSIRDNGVGIPTNHPQGMGLRTISYRAAIIGAEIKTTSGPSLGTSIECSLPRSQHDSRSA